MPQSQVSAIMHTGNWQRRVTALDVFGCIADGLVMPDDARALLGLAPREVDRGRAVDAGTPLGPAAIDDGDPEP